MTAEELHQAAVDLVVRSTGAQGLPTRLEDPATLERVAAILTTPQEDAQTRRSGPKAASSLIEAGDFPLTGTADASMMP